MTEDFQILAFYEFKDMSSLGDLAAVRSALREVLRSTGVRGTIILADEGFNGMVCGMREEIARFVTEAESVLRTTLKYKSSFNSWPPFRKIDVKIKPEIVTLKRPVEMALAAGTHVSPSEWNEIISDPNTVVLDTRNDYEYQSGTFEGAVNPSTSKFSELPDFVEQELDPATHKHIAVFCTGGIRCEKFAPYLIERGFENVYQLDGGILNYLQSVPREQNLWRGECFVFDERITVDADLKKGREPDRSQRRK